MSTECVTFRSDNEAARRLELSTFIRESRRDIKGEAQRREGFFQREASELKRKIAVWSLGALKSRSDGR